MQSALRGREDTGSPKVLGVLAENSLRYLGGRQELQYLIGVDDVRDIVYGSPGSSLDNLRTVFMRAPYIRAFSLGLLNVTPDVQYIRYR